MPTKAILVTTSNMQKLASDFSIDEDDVKQFVGLFLVVDFGVEDHYEIVSAENLAKKYTPGKKLLHDWVDLVRITI